jgi:transcriptional regulator with XRE-family HTH domain
MNKTISLEIASRFKAIREAKNLTLRGLAGLIGKTVSTIQNYERHDSKPAVAYILLLHNKLRVSLSYLLKGEGEMFLEKDLSTTELIESLKSAINEKNKLLKYQGKELDQLKAELKQLKI